MTKSSPHSGQSTGVDTIFVPLTHIGMNSCTRRLRAYLFSLDFHGSSSQWNTVTVVYMYLLKFFSIVQRIPSRVLLWLNPNAECFNVWRAVRSFPALLLPILKGPTASSETH
jgi:hypothetical protein